MDLHFPVILDNIKAQLGCFMGFTPSGFVSGPIKSSTKASTKATGPVAAFPGPIPPWAALVDILGRGEVEKFLFDSGEVPDGDEDLPLDELVAFRDTAQELIAADLFHLPYPAMWIEDYFASNPNLRLYYLCIEHDGRIWTWSLAPFGPDFPVKSVSVAAAMLWDPEVMAFRSDVYGYWRLEENGKITDPKGSPNLTVPTDLGKVLYRRQGMATVMLQKFIATLAASNTVRERGETVHRTVRPGRDPMSRREKDFRTVVYGYHHVYPPIDDDEPVGEDGHRPRKRHFVRGYTWGRHTRPKDQQRWIAPFWRGRSEVARRSHYEIKADG